MTKTQKGESVWVLVDSALDACGCSVYHNLEDLYDSVINDYELEESEMTELKKNGNICLGESTIFVMKSYVF